MTHPTRQELHKVQSPQISLCFGWGLLFGVALLGTPETHANVTQAVIVQDDDEHHKSFLFWTPPWNGGLGGAGANPEVSTGNWSYDISATDFDNDGFVDDLIFDASHDSDPPPHQIPAGEIAGNPLGIFDFPNANMAFPAPVPGGPPTAATWVVTHPFIPGHVDWIQIQFDSVVAGVNGKWKISVQFDHSGAGELVKPDPIPTGGFPEPATLSLFSLGGLMLVRRRRHDG